jgi:hypothetical protein
MAYAAAMSAKLGLLEGLACYDEILQSEPDPEDSPDSDLNETLGKVWAKDDDVITKAGLFAENIIYSENGKFPILGTDSKPPVDTQWQHTPNHGLLINGMSHVLDAVDTTVQSIKQKKTFQAVNKEVQAKAAEGKPAKFSKEEVWRARSALYLIRLFASAIG